ncbi:tyrosine-type recombinase/integrase [Halomarina oriensis]|uniref:Tyrosine-type recombinase/integrase n=1 Tax=Halomarina oriensis TaxID=671145 RepID=A0A6B0GPX3_9EURY|nr:site-specific integrase [Halomarina oriensis]MWG36936.1 tyrosine-type recombinase/integrase [Halomarina oriensis]
MTERRRRDPGDLAPRDAVRRYLRRRASDSTEKSVHGWEYRLKLWVEWCEGIGLDRVDDVRRWDVDEYYELRSSAVAPATLEGEMWTLKMFCEFLEDLGAVEDGLADAVRIPDLDPEDRSNDTKLRTEHALALLRYYRMTPAVYATRAHAYLELAWTTGARQSGLRALDIRDLHTDGAPYLDFRHRPDTGTGLKNKLGGERPVAVTEETASVLQEFIQTHRYDVHDDHGRQPLLASAQGRPGPNTVRVWSYLATLPCQHVPCPHGQKRETCEKTEYAHASKCPSSRSPHQIRTGAITWFLNLGWPPEDVAERVNATVKTIEQHYDKADPEQRRRRLRERMEKRRRPLVDELSIDDEDPLR